MGPTTARSERFMAATAWWQRTGYSRYVLQSTTLWRTLYLFIRYQLPTGSTSTVRLRNVLSLSARSANVYARRTIITLTVRDWKTAATISGLIMAAITSLPARLFYGDERALLT